MALKWSDLQNVFREQEEEENASEKLRRERLQLEKEKLAHKKEIDARKQALAERKQALEEAKRQQRTEARGLWIWTFLVLGSLTLEFIVLLIVLTKY